MQFTKMHGLGNQYIFVNQLKENLPEADLKDLAIEVADIYTGIGSDGLILIGSSEKADLQMRVFNKDGSEAKNCGNGLRCVAKYAYDKGLVAKTTMTIETKEVTVEATVTVHEKTNNVRLVTVDMGQPFLQPDQIPVTGVSTTPVVNEDIEVEGKDYKMTAVSMGNPHVVFFVDDINQAPLTTVGAKVEWHERFPEGVNVEFVEVVSEKELNFRVWERGSGITQACGTGACAAVVAAVLNSHSSKGEEVLVHLAGGDLQIKWDNDGRVWMTGPAEYICEGEFYRRVDRV
ncbi:diaminopimelate epimerase [Evansella sp. AB-rgal1]|uniref:diaminopimelate epimerase n=1 Tax=Evansella sp. AB-rgal1 TaxID=3242696 RepID=UPI00359D6E58